MTPQGHPAGSVRAREGFVCIAFEDGGREEIRRSEYARVRNACSAAQRAVRMLYPVAMLDTIPLSIEVAGLHGEVKSLDLLRVRSITDWPASALVREAEDEALYSESGQPWDS